MFEVISVDMLCNDGIPTQMTEWSAMSTLQSLNAKIGGRRPSLRPCGAQFIPDQCHYQCPQALALAHGSDRNAGFGSSDSYII